MVFFCEFTFKCRVEREVTSVEMGETVPHGCVWVRVAQIWVKSKCKSESHLRV